MNLFKKLFKRKPDPNAALRKLEKIKNKIDRKIAQFSRLKEKKGIKQATMKMIDEGIDKLKEERAGVIETIEKLTH